jgi:hypothetical protein
MSRATRLSARSRKQRPPTQSHISRWQARKEEPLALSYCRVVYAETLAWYRVADAKGQLLLTLDGIFITVLAGVVLTAPKDLIARKLDVGWTTWTLPTMTAIATVASVACALGCLHSRLTNSSLRAHTDEFLIPGAVLGYRPAVTFWFGTLAGLDRHLATDMLRSADPDFELDVLSEQICYWRPTSWPSIDGSTGAGWHLASRLSYCSSVQQVLSSRREPRSTVGGAMDEPVPCVTRNSVSS